MKHEHSHNHRVDKCKNCQKQLECLDHYSKHELSCNAGEFIPTFVPISQFEKNFVSPSSPTADINTTRIADEVTLPSHDIRYVENVAVENVAVSSATRNSINETSKSSQKHYMKNYRTAKEKIEYLEILIRYLPSPVQRTVS